MKREAWFDTLSQYIIANNIIGYETLEKEHPIISCVFFGAQALFFVVETTTTR
jgi:hypothetical protein